MADTGGKLQIADERAAESAAILAEDADLRAIIEGWPDLPQAIKTAILALLRASEES